MVESPLIIITIIIIIIIRRIKIKLFIERVPKQMSLNFHGDVKLKRLL